LLNKLYSQCLLYKSGERLYVNLYQYNYIGDY
jgi:hypothetical protein